MKIIEVFPIPFVNILNLFCAKLKIDSPVYTNELEGAKFRFTVQLELGKTEYGEKNIVKIKGVPSKDLGFAMASAAEKGIHRLKNSYNFYVHDINFDATLELRESLTQAQHENNGLRYKMDLFQFSHSTISNFYLERIQDLEEEVAMLKAELQQHGGAEGSAGLEDGAAGMNEWEVGGDQDNSIETDPSEANSSQNDIYD